MMGLLESAYVIGRRDFTATVFSKAFIFFLLGPVILLGVSFLLGGVGERMARQDMRSSVAVIASEAEFNAIEAAQTRLAPAFQDYERVALVHAEPDYVIAAQIDDLLESREQRIVAVLTGGIDRPRLTGAISETSNVRDQMQLVVEEARQARVLARAGAAPSPIELEFVEVAESAGSIASLRTTTARAAQMILFMLTVFLPAMLLSNFVEEKSNKVIEVLTAAVPIDAIFLGKLFAMLCVSLVGIAVWVFAALLGLALWPPESLFDLTAPAVGWPLFILLVLIYYCANYLLLGAFYLGMGSQASSVREVQTLPIPIMVVQVFIFLFASLAVGSYSGFVGIAAAIFPFSSPLAMVSLAAQAPELWPHLLAIAWQALWVWLSLKLAAGFFRRNVLKSGSGSASTSALGQGGSTA